MKILYVSPYCFGLERSLPHALEHMGADVRAVIYGEHNKEKGPLGRWIYTRYGLVKTAKRALDRLGILNRILERSTHRIAEQVLQNAKAFQPDVIFVTKGEVFNRRVIEELKSIAPIAVYYWDDPFLEHVSAADGTKDIRYQNIRSVYDVYDVSFVYDEHYVGPLKEHGARRPMFLLQSFDPDVFRPSPNLGKESPEWGADISFVGAPYENRIALLKALRAHDVAVWGPYFRWREYFAAHPFLKKQYRGEAAAPQAAMIYRSSKINLNLHDTFQCMTSVNNRTFEILACGAFQLADDRPMIRQLFQPGKDLDLFQTLEQAKQKARYYLDHDDERKAIATHGLGSVQGHSVADRARQILTTLEGMVEERRSGRLFTPGSKPLLRG